MSRTLAILALAASLLGCDAVNTVTQGFGHAKAVESELATSVGLKPSVGFNWHNGRLIVVTVTFPGVYETKPLNELASLVQASVSKQFKQTPEKIVLAFALTTKAPGRSADGATGAAPGMFAQVKLTER